ncbi:hypothetical protein, partial [Aeromonas sobria]|uniref:hypothetical protein n=1 Tax=Aeromonas sobria TaxID=646 RepID=UPI0026EA942D
GFSRLPTELFALPRALSMGRIIEIQLTLARLYRNLIAKKCNLLVIHVNAQPLHRLIHNSDMSVGNSPCFNPLIL